MDAIFLAVQERGFDEAEASHADAVVPLAVERAQVRGEVVKVVYEAQYFGGYDLYHGLGRRQVGVGASGCGVSRFWFGFGG